MKHLKKCILILMVLALLEAKTQPAATAQARFAPDRPALVAGARPGFGGSGTDPCGSVAPEGAGI